MARKRKPVKRVVLVAARAARLYKLLGVLGQRPQTREVILKRLKWNVRGFYRDLEWLRDKLGVEVTLAEGRYVLAESAQAVQDRLPFPDPGLTLGEAQQLARGRTAAHNRLRQQIAAITG
jgi:hypothetical protein